MFIDADKPNTAAYFDWALKLTRRGSLIIADNVVRDGAVIDAGSTDANVQGVRRFNAALAAEPRVTATVIQTVGSKGTTGSRSPSSPPTPRPRPGLGKNTKKEAAQSLLPLLTSGGRAWARTTDLVLIRNAL